MSDASLVCAPPIPTSPHASPAQPSMMRINDHRADSLCDAVAAGQLEVVNSFLKSNVNPNVPGNKGQLPLCVACAFGRWQIADLLVANGAYASLADHQGNTALHYASQHGDIDTVRWLVETCHASVTSQNILKQLPIVLACEARHVQVAEYLSAVGGVHPRDDVWLSPWSRWATLGYFARREAQSRLFDVARENNAEVARRHLCNPYAAYFIHEQRSCFKANIVYAKRTALHEACSFGSLQVAQLLVSCGADADAPSYDDWYTPLHCACQKNRIQVVKWLIETVLVDPLSLTIKKKTPHAVAAQNQSWKVLEYLETNPVVVAELSFQQVEWFSRVCECECTCDVK
eukprot:c8401_g2_i2.p1 GENE.c8401_g2_i2~~c8401_g2_i2.p1  ORF type:complete len:345 (+),score=63.99 c8401_g2_i2:29-1063(+)